jgi:hypothetical protein
MTYQELREQIAKVLFHHTTMEHDWESRKEWVKDSYRKEADEIFNLIKEWGWIIIPKPDSHSENDVTSDPR